MPRDRSRRPWVLYFATLAALAAGILVPHARAWGVNVWARVPLPLAMALLGIAGLGPFLAIRLAPRLPEAVSRRLPPLGLVLLAASFYVLRTKAHFLGDGYQNLSLLAADPVRVKATAKGTLQLLAFLKSVVGGGESGALAAYRTIAFASGVAYLALVVFAGRRLVSGSFERRGFIAILATCGVSVMFFGYVENYAPFVLAVTAHALHGIHVVRTGRTRWAAPAITGAAIYFHVLGFTLLPSLAWILASGTPIGNSLSGTSVRLRTLVGVGIVAAGLATLEAVRHDHLALEFALVPFTNTRYALQGYTLLSGSHLLDLANLLLLLLPGVGVLAAAALGAREHGPVPAFLAVLTGSTSAAVLLLDPKLGMPRDWDVFAFAGIPWAVTGAWMWASASRRRPALRPAGPLAALLGVVVLVPRLFVLGSAERALPLFRDYLELDPSRGRNARVHIVNYYRGIGRDDLAEAEIDAWNRDYPERGYLQKGIAARNRGDVAEAIEWYLRALRISPQYFDAYNNLADAYLLQERPNQAIELLRIALAIDPGEPGVLTNFGTAEYMRGDHAAARRYWEEALIADPDGFHPSRNLARLAQQEGDQVAYERLLGRAAASPEAPGTILVEWAGILTSRGRRDDARSACREALRRGIPEELATVVFGRFPELRPQSPP